MMKRKEARKRAEELAMEALRFADNCERATVVNAVTGEEQQAHIQEICQGVAAACAYLSTLLGSGGDEVPDSPRKALNACVGIACRNLYIPEEGA